MLRAIICGLATTLVATSSFALPVTFEVEVPVCSPPGAPIYLRSNRTDVATFGHDELTAVDATHYRGTFEVSTDVGSFEYKYSHDICDATACPGIEKALDYTGSAGDIASRTLMTGQAVTDDHVLIWRSALKRADGSVREPAEQVAFCSPYVVVNSESGGLSVSYDSYLGMPVVLEYGPDANYGQTLTSAGSFRNHFRLPAAPPGSTVHYRIVENGVPGPGQQLTLPQDEVRIAMFGDTQFYGDQQRLDHQAITQHVEAFAPDLMLAVGDLVASEPGPGGPGGWDFPEMARWNVFYSVMAPLMATAPFMTAMGNHEEDAPYFWDVFDYPSPDAPAIDHYDFRYGPLWVGVLYTGTTDGYDMQGILQSQQAWLTSVLSRAEQSDARWKMIVVHRGPHSQGANHPTDGQAFYETTPDGGDSWQTLFERYGVDVVLAGHNHNLTVANSGRTHFITACSGAPVHQLDASVRPTTLYAESTCSANFLEAGALLRFTAARPDGSLIDEAELLLCKQGADCQGQPHTCPQLVQWDCVDTQCSSSCVNDVIEVTPTNLSFSLRADDAPDSQAISVRSQQGTALPFAFDCTTASWLSCTSTASQTPATVIAQVDATGLAPGDFDAVARVGGTDVMVQLTVTEDPPPLNRAPPTPELLSPEDRDIVAPAVNLVVSSVVDPDGDAVRYHFDISGDDRTEPQPGTTWAGEEGRTYSWRVRAIDAQELASDWSPSRVFSVRVSDVEVPEDAGCSCRNGEAPNPAWGLLLLISLACRWLGTRRRDR